MAVFTLNKPIVTKEPFIKVDNKLQPGRYLFQLVAVDEQGNQSKPSSIIVTVNKSSILVNSGFTRG